MAEITNDQIAEMLEFHHRLQRYLDSGVSFSAALRQTIEDFQKAAPETPEEIDNFLRQQGYDPEELAQKARDIFKDALATSPLNRQNRPRVEQVGLPYTEQEVQFNQEALDGSRRRF